MEDGVLIVDERNRIRFLNRPAFLIRQKTGLIKQSAESLIGQDLKVCHEGAPQYQKRALAMIKSLKEKQAKKFVHISLIDNKIFKNTYKALWKDKEFKGVYVISKRVTGRLSKEELETKSIKQFAQEFLHGVVLVMDSIMGAKKVVGDPVILEINGKQEEVNLPRLGSFYIVAIGQGHSRSLNTLFGPLPVLDFYDWRGFIYPFETENLNNPENSVEGTDYNLFVLLYPHILEEMFDYTELSKLIQEHLSTVKYTKDLTNNLIKNVKNDILAKKYS